MTEFCAITLPEELTPKSLKDCRDCGFISMGHG